MEVAFQWERLDEKQLNVTNDEIRNRQKSALKGEAECVEEDSTRLLFYIGRGICNFPQPAWRCSPEVVYSPSKCLYKSAESVVKFRHMDILALGHTDSKWGSWDLSPGSLTARSHPLHHRRRLLVILIARDFSVILCSVQPESSCRVTTIRQVENLLEDSPKSSFQSSGINVRGVCQGILSP